MTNGKSRDLLNPMHLCEFAWTRVGARQIIGSLLLLFVFSLPLHLHVADESGQIGHECSCIHGTGTQLAAPASSVIFTAIPAVLFVTAKRTEALVSLSVESDPARAPPAFL